MENHSSATPEQYSIRSWWKPSFSSTLREATFPTRTLAVIFTAFQRGDRIRSVTITETPIYPPGIL